MRLKKSLFTLKKKKKPFLTIKNRIFQSPKNRIFFQRGQPMLLVKKCHFFLYLDWIKITLEIMLSDFAKKPKLFFTLENSIFLSPKNRHFLLYLNLIKIGLEIMLSDFPQEKETFFDLKSRILKVQKIA